MRSLGEEKPEVGISKDTDLHVYLESKPSPAAFKAILDLYGFEHSKDVDATKTEPHTTYYTWDAPHLSTSGFQLLHFEDLFKDDLNTDRYESFVILSGYQDSSEVDFTMIDITAVFLLGRYGGRLHNPQRIEKISTSYFLSGTPYVGPA